MLRHIAYRFNSSARRDAKHKDLSLLWFQKTYNESKQGTFTRSILAGKHYEFAAMYMEADISEHFCFAITKAQIMAPDGNIIRRMRQCRFDRSTMFLAFYGIQATRPLP